MKNQEKTASFISKLYNILKSKQHSKAILWDSQNKGIRIVNQKKLEQTVLPRYYRHNRFASFVRQLNMYDFHKIYLGDHRSVFCHDTFNPQDKETLLIVKRKVTFNIQTNDKNSNELIQNSFVKSNQSNRQIKSINSFIPSKKNIWTPKSSFKLFQNSIQHFDGKKSEKIQQLPELTEDQAIEELIQQILPLNLQPSDMKIKIKKFLAKTIYRRFLRNRQFKRNLYQRLGLQFDEYNEKLSELSIQGQLLIRTRKFLTQKSLKMFQSGPINFKDTIGCLIYDSTKGINNISL